MKRMLINASHEEEVRVALVDGQKLFDLDIEHLSRESTKANIYKGKITRIEESLEAAFVDYGAERHGFLPIKEISKDYLKVDPDNPNKRPRITDLLKKDLEIIVQVDKEERGTKGAALTTYISLAGRYLVLMPNKPHAGGISRRIEGEERSELKASLDALKTPEDMGVIVRTAGCGRTTEELQWDLDYLQQHWKNIITAAGRPAPFLIDREGDVINRAVRDNLRQDIDEVLVDNEDVYEKVLSTVKSITPKMQNRVKIYKDTIPLFNRYQVETQIETAFEREVKLPSGGSIVIDPTEALVSIDINSARATKGADIEETALHTNLEAADEIARQLRLRDIGGLVVIDFIDMGPPRNQREVEGRMRSALEIDRARIQTSRISRFGLMEISRQRLRPSLRETSGQVCPRCSGVGAIRDVNSLALAIMRLVEEEALKEHTSYVQAQVPVEVATYLLNEKREAISEIESRQKVTILIIPNVNLETPHFSVVRMREDQASQAGVTKKTSYELVEDFETKEAPTSSFTATRAQPQQAAVQKIERTALDEIPAAKAQTGLIGRFLSWFDALFEAKPVEQVANSTTQSAPAHTQRNERSQQQRRRNNQRSRNQRNDSRNRSSQNDRQSNQSRNRSADRNSERTDRSADRNADRNTERQSNQRTDDGASRNSRRNERGNRRDGRKRNENGRQHPRQGDNGNQRNDGRTNNRQGQNQDRNQDRSQGRAAPRRDEVAPETLPERNRGRGRRRNQSDNRRTQVANQPHSAVEEANVPNVIAANGSTPAGNSAPTPNATSATIASVPNVANTTTDTQNAPIAPQFGMEMPPRALTKQGESANPAGAHPQNGNAPTAPVAPTEASAGHETNTEARQAVANPTDTAMTQTNDGAENNPVTDDERAPRQRPSNRGRRPRRGDGRRSNQEPSAHNKEPSAQNREPSAHNKEQSAQNQAPSTIGNEQSARNKEPSADTKQPSPTPQPANPPKADVKTDSKADAKAPAGLANDSIFQSPGELAKPAPRQPKNRGRALNDPRARRRQRLEAEKAQQSQTADKPQASPAAVKPAEQNGPTNTAGSAERATPAVVAASDNAASKDA